MTALYEITLKEPLRYGAVEEPVSEHTDELGFLKIRYKQPDEASSREMRHAILEEELQEGLGATSNNFRFSAAVAAFGQLLRRSAQIGDYSYGDVLMIARDSRGSDSHGYRSEFLKLVEVAEALE